MAYLDGIQAANDNLLAVAKVGAMAALRAPLLAKTKIKIEILTGEDLSPLAEILAIAGEGSAFVYGDAVNAKKAFEAGTSVVELLIGCDATVSDLAWNCGACGFDSCAEFNHFSREHRGPGNFFVGPSCNWKLFDHGMAMSYASAAISGMNVECRQQASYGFAALACGYMEGCNMCIGISLGPCGDSIWYDRVFLEHSFDMAEHFQYLENTLPQLFVGFCGGGHPLAKVGFGPNWAAKPKFWKATEDPEFLAKQQDISARVGQIIARERAKRAAKKKT